MKALLLALFALLSYGRVVATTYYLSVNGDDASEGKRKSTPWQSLKNLSSVNLVSGDSVLFERGSLFTGEFILSNSGVFLGAYGQGPNPIFGGLTPLNNWISLGENIWKANCSACVVEPGNLFMDGRPQPLGRYPNKGYLTVSGSSKNKTSISDATSRFSSGYWKGAEIVIRSSRWTLDNLLVKDYINKTFIFSAPASYDIQNGFGYFIQKHSLTLDQAGEWYFDRVTGEISLYMNPGSNPNDHKIQVSTYGIGLRTVNAHDITIENLAFKYYRASGVQAEKCSRITIQNIKIFASGKNGLEVISSQQIQIRNSVISNSNNNGVNWLNNSQGLFEDNMILCSGLYAGRGMSGNGTYIALNILSDASSTGDNVFQNNRIDSTGYIGIDFRTGGTRIENNTITNFCMVKDDGAGIYTWGNARGNNSIEGNTIDRGIGTGEGTVNSRELFASGIYIDDRSSNVVVKNNKVSHCSTSGIFLHNARNITVVGNTLFANGNSLSNKERGQLYIKLDTLGRLGGNTDLQLAVSQNKFIADREGSYCVFLSAKKKSDLGQLGKFIQNEYSATYDRQTVAQLYNLEGLCSAPDEFTLADWQNDTPYETGSVFNKLSTKGNFVVLSKNLVKNGDMILGRKGWIVWPEKSTILEEKNKTNNGISLKINIPVNSEALLYNQGFALTRGKLYRLSFSAMGSKPTKLEFVPLMASSPWQALGSYTCFSIDSTSRTFTYFFRADKNCDLARVNFKSNVSFTISNVSLFEVSDRTDVR